MQKKINVNATLEGLVDCVNDHAGILRTHGDAFRTYGDVMRQEFQINVRERYKVEQLERRVMFLSILCAVSMATVFAMAAFLVYGRQV